MTYIDHQLMDYLLLMTLALFLHFQQQFGVEYHLYYSMMVVVGENYLIGIEIIRNILCFYLLFGVIARGRG
jgi:hypothetical protein